MSITMSEWDRWQTGIQNGKSSECTSGSTGRPVRALARKVWTIVGVIAVLTLLSSGTSWSREIWSPESAQTWYAHQPWMIGANYIPATAINQLEMWQAETFDPDRIDLELGWAEGIGMNTMRVFLHDLLWEQDPDGFKKRIDTFLSISQKHHIRILFVLFDSVWEPEPKLGPQHPAIPGVHNSGWVKSPALSALRDPTQEPRLKAYVQGIVGAFARDTRILGWDVWNEPKASDEKDLTRVEALLPKVFEWAREANPSQPLTSGLYTDGEWMRGKPSEIDRVQLAQSDVLSFHDYHWPETFEAKAIWLQRRGRPVWCTEYLARGVGSTFEGFLPIAKRLNLAMFNWGLVDGKTQTRLPWDSWTIPYVGGREPAVWHHDIFHFDGTPYRIEEIPLIRAFSSAPKGVVPRSLVP
jgi:hypothetical protein